MFAIVIGGNCETLDDMLDLARFLQDEGLGVLLLTRTGYPDPAEDYSAAPGEGWLASLRRQVRHAPTEASMLADAQTALAWLQTAAPGRAAVPPSRVLAVGQSMGTFAAHALGAATPELAGVLALQPFACAPSVATTIACNTCGALLWPLPRALVVRVLWAPLALIVHVAVRLGYRSVNAPLSNLRAAARVQGGYCVVGSTHDDLMAFAHGGTAPYRGVPAFSGNAADALIATYEAEQCGPSLRLQLSAPGPKPGEHNYGCPPDHCCDFGWPEHAEVAEAVRQFVHTLAAQG